MTSKSNWNRIFPGALILVALLATSRAASSATPIAPTDLRCEYLANPIGIDDIHPRLSWVLEVADHKPSAPRGLRQTA
jgi:alpha-L-rhamnosidase